ncbi:RNA-binding protein [Penicillium manginii]|uniref:RNA-binding protein n=1 Tax=Penicillium manginii TaxID=203109 RepID=UPI002548672A|nr:RNA-binding protein [Penicillium manginii]KAJ5750945.1 RNA-binding protein [Penicillium manginii]
MAEPEDLEEDLFADLYDADESTNRTTSAVETSKSAEPVAAAVPTPAEEPATAISAVPSYESSAPDSYPAYQAPQQDYNTGYQNGSQAPAVSAQAPNADHEPHGSGSGTGIKEDG